MSRKFFTSFLRPIIGGILLFTTTPKAYARPVTALQDTIICQKKTSPQEKSLKQSEEVLQSDSESDFKIGNKNSPNQIKRKCKTLKSPETTDLERTSADTNADELGILEDSLDNTEITEDVTNVDANDAEYNSRDVENINGGDGYIPDYPVEQLDAPLPQDSHDTTINLDVNLGGGGETSPIDSTDTTTPETDLSEAQPTESSSPASTNTEKIVPQLPASPKSKAKVKKLHLKKIHKAKEKLQREKVKAQEKRDRLFHSKRGKPSFQNHPKSDRMDRKSLKHHPGRLHSKPHRSKASSSLGRRSRFQPARSHFRKQVRPTKVLRTPSHRTH
jgi:hypothetical protein